MKNKTNISRRFISVVPSTASVGGIAKVLDYATHATRCGYESVFATVSNVLGTENLFSKPYYQKYKNKIKIIKFDQLSPHEDDIILFSLPSNHKKIVAKYANVNMKEKQLIHIVQNVRHTNIYFDNGYAFRLLPKNILRICITDQVYKEIYKWVDNKSDLYLIKHGFDFNAFAKVPKKSDRISVTYNKFKSNLGDIILEEAKKEGIRFNVHVIEKGASWQELCNSYRNNTIFIGTPLIEEGLYLPGLEAMAAGCLVITSDAIGNKFYTKFGDNAIEAKHSDHKSYIRALKYIIRHWETLMFQIRKNAYETAKTMDLEEEYKQFKQFLYKNKLLEIEPKLDISALYIRNISI